MYYAANDKRRRSTIMFWLVAAGVAVIAVRSVQMFGFDFAGTLNSLVSTVHQP